VFATLFSLLNGAVLGFIHPALTPDLQPSASDWRIGTLLVAGGATLFIGQSATGAMWVVPIANACWLMGLALYWRSLRRFYGLRDRLWIYVPVLLGVAGNVAFLYPWPDIGYRVAVATVSWVIIIAGAALTLLRHRRRERSISSAVLCGIFIGLGVLMIARGVYFLLIGKVLVSIAQPLNWVNALTPLLIAVLPVIGTTAFVLLCFERIRAELHRAATTDALTGLPNRRTISEQADLLFGLARAAQAPIAVAVIDVDHFKSINDRFGHDVGDIVLKRVAAILQSQCRGDQVVGRQGGEEFVALLPEADDASALIAAERLRAAIADTPIPVSDDQHIQVTLSIGVATSLAARAGVGDTFKRADIAMYEAKSRGRNRVCVSSPGG